MTDSKSQAGFTLIELIVVVGIMLLLVGFGIVNFIQFNERQRLLLSARELQIFIRSAQTAAQTKPTSAISCSVPGESVQGFSVRSNSEGKITTFAVASLCGSSPSAISGTGTSLSANTSFTLHESVTLETPIEIEFYTLGKGGRVISPANGTVVLSAPSYSLSFTISPEGSISEGVIIEADQNENDEGSEIGGNNDSGDSETGPVED